MRVFGGINVWRVAKLKVVGKLKSGKWIDFVHKDTNYKLKFEFVESQMIH